MVSHDRPLMVKSAELGINAKHESSSRYSASIGMRHGGMSIAEQDALFIGDAGDSWVARAGISVDAR